MGAEILSIGSELLLGQTPDTNAAYIAAQLARAGIEVQWQTTVADREGAIAEALRLALARSEIVIASGGLGATGDDLTRQALAGALGRSLVLERGVLDAIRRRFAARGLSMPDGSERQALIPDGATVLVNRHGTAPGLFVETRDGRVVVALPGVPAEMRPMLTEQVIPRLRARFGVKRTIRWRVLKACGTSESHLEGALKDVVLPRAALPISLLPHPGEIHILLRLAAESDSEGERGLDEVEAAIRARLGDRVFGRDEDRLEEVVGRLLRDGGQTIAVAESCTGGLVCHRLTNVPGSSAYLLRGAVVYSNEAKVAMLGVPADMLTRHGAVSRPVAEAMAAGMRRAAGTDLALGITGIAGPEGGSPGKPVGLTYVALASATTSLCRELRFLADRETNKWLASQEALDMVRRHLLSLRNAPTP
jgi:nicotinamide-nucleotide amidase